MGIAGLTLTVCPQTVVEHHVMLKGVAKSSPIGMAKHSCCLGPTTAPHYHITLQDHDHEVNSRQPHVGIRARDTKQLAHGVRAGSSEQLTSETVFWFIKPAGGEGGCVVRDSVGEAKQISGSQ